MIYIYVINIHYIHDKNLIIDIYGMNTNGLSRMCVNVNDIGDKTKNGRERLRRKMKYITELIDRYDLNVTMMQEGKFIIKKMKVLV